MVPVLLLALLLEPVTARVTVGWEEGRVVAVKDREEEEAGGTEKEEESFEPAVECEEVEERR